MNDVQEIIEAVEQASKNIESMQTQWDEYQKLKKDVIEAAKNNPYLNERMADQIVRCADSIKSDFGNVKIMESAVFLIKQGIQKEYILKIIDTAYKMTDNNILEYSIAIFRLRESLNCKTDYLEVIYPAIGTFTKEELAAGKAIDFIAEKL